MTFTSSSTHLKHQRKSCSDWATCVSTKAHGTRYWWPAYLPDVDSRLTSLTIGARRTQNSLQAKTGNASRLKLKAVGARVCCTKRANTRSMPNRLRREYAAFSKR